MKSIVLLPTRILIKHRSASHSDYKTATPNSALSHTLVIPGTKPPNHLVYCYRIHCTT